MEILLSDVFRAFKPAILLKQIDNKDINYDLKKPNKTLFNATKTILKVTNKEIDRLYGSYLVIKRLREEQKGINKPFLWKNDRLFPLPFHHYDNLAYRIYQRSGCPKFGCVRIDGVRFGEPITEFSNYVNGKSYSNMVIKRRLVGTVLRENQFSTKLELTSIIDSIGEWNLRLRRRK